MEHTGCSRSAGTLEDYDTPEFRVLCDRLVERTAEQIAEYAGCGYRFDAFIGVEGSPSCAVTRAPAPGVFVRELATRLERYGIPFTAVDRHLADGGIARVLEALDAG
jgi:predicted secreted protein